MQQLIVATEDQLSEVVVDRLLMDIGVEASSVTYMGRTGYGAISKKLTSLITVAYSLPVVILIDLDQKECAPSLVRDWMGNRNKPDKLLLRVAVREVESWLLADHESFAEFASVPLNRLNDPPDGLGDPKQTLLNLVARNSPAPIRKDLVGDYGGGPVQGVSYNQRLTQFVRSTWRPEVASSRSDSLSRMRLRLEELAHRN